MEIRSYKIEKEMFLKLNELSNKDYYHFESIKEYNGRQCKNSLGSCRVGVFSEYVAGLYLKELLKENDIPYKCSMLGLKERQDSVVYDKGDILINIPNKKLTVEVKGVDKGYPIGQLLPYHVKKYVKNGVDRICLVQVSLCYYTYTATCVVYNCIKPEEALQWPLKNNLRGVPCYTMEETITQDILNDNN